jgi:hypothetical protein
MSTKSNQSRDSVPLSLNVKKEHEQCFRYFPAYAAATAGVLMSLSSVMINLKKEEKSAVNNNFSVAHTKLPIRPNINPAL